MFCMKCGTKLPEEAVFCVKCGNKTVAPSRSSEEKIQTQVSPTTAEPEIITSTPPKPVAEAPEIQEVPMPVIKEPEPEVQPTYIPKERVRPWDDEVPPVSQETAQTGTTEKKISNILSHSTRNTLEMNGLDPVVKGITYNTSYMSVVPTRVGELHFSEDGLTFSTIEGSTESGHIAFYYSDLKSVEITYFRRLGFLTLTTKDNEKFLFSGSHKKKCVKFINEMMNTSNPFPFEPSIFYSTVTRKNKPLSNGLVNLVCAMAIGFLISSVLVFTGTVTGEAAKYTPAIAILFILSLSFFFCQIDEGTLRSQGGDTSNAKPWIWLAPVYLHQRNKVTREVFPYSILWAVSMGLSLLCYIL